MSDSELKTLLNRRGQRSVVREVVPLVNLNTIIEGTIAILDEQVEKLRLKSKGANFGAEDAKILQSYIKSVIDLSREEREREAKDEYAKQLAAMTPEQLLQEYESKVKQLK